MKKVLDSNAVRIPMIFVPFGVLFLVFWLYPEVKNYDWMKLVAGLCPLFVILIWTPLVWLVGRKEDKSC